jgi:hypothetical protein
MRGRITGMAVVLRASNFGWRIPVLKSLPASAHDLHASTAVSRVLASRVLVEPCCGAPCFGEPCFGKPQWGDSRGKSRASEHELECTVLPLDRRGLEAIRAAGLGR